MQRRLCEMSEAKCLQISHNKYASQRDAISHSMGNLMLSHSAGMHNTDKSIAGISKRFHFASLISHNLRCIPAYTHQIPMGFFFNHYQIITGTTCISPPKLFDVGGQNLMWEGQSLAIRSIALVRSVFSFPFRPCDELPSRSCEASLFRFYGMPLPTG